MVDNQLREALLAELEEMSPDLQEQVLEYARSLRQEKLPPGASGDVVRKHFGAIGEEAGEELKQIIEEGCEQVDPGEW